ncbi:hypothetical protein AVEN_207370-1 [Araneus ventricosus]|uniref:Uncharacterized protein n=1 Tax=Araneus ventricosus TaxID=182803 RepID=A0A4Y2KEB1_ARAVE|nr:hypothetical protein AVEN_207370-1 [Araneus ventricosus]
MLRGEESNFLEDSPYLGNQASPSLETTRFPDKHLAPKMSPSPKIAATLLLFPCVLEICTKHYTKFYRDQVVAHRHSALNAGFYIVDASIRSTAVSR